MPSPKGIWRLVISSALLVLPRGSRCLPRPSLGDEPYHRSRRSDGDSGSIMVIAFSGMVLIALVYVLVIGWRKTEPLSKVQTEQQQHDSNGESPPETSQVGGRVHVEAEGRTLSAE